MVRFLSEMGAADGAGLSCWAPVLVVTAGEQSLLSSSAVGQCPQAEWVLEESQGLSGGVVSSLSESSEHISFFLNER